METLTLPTRRAALKSWPGWLPGVRDGHARLSQLSQGARTGTSGPRGRHRLRREALVLHSQVRVVFGGQFVNVARCPLPSTPGRQVSNRHGAATATAPLCRPASPPCRPAWPFVPIAVCGRLLRLESRHRPFCISFACLAAGCGQAPSRAVQNAQLCVFAKFVSVCGAGGASDCIFWVRLLKSGQNGVPNEEGNPRLAKFVQ